jgi:Spy/CpxP family protein refolding chaperone
MKKFTIAALVLALAGFGAAAMACDGPKGHKGKGPEQRLERMSEHLDLTPEQREQVKQAFEANKAKHEGAREAMHADMKASLAKILSQEQMAKFDEMHAKHRDGMGTRPE